jgi:hypothetical protein
MRTDRTATRLAPLLLAAGVLAAPLGAQERMAIYRCTAADGTVTVQNDRPCPSDTMQQDRRVIRTAPAVAVPAPAAGASPGSQGDSSPAATRAAPGAPPPTATPATPATGLVAPAPAATSMPATAPATLTVPPQTSGVPAPTALSAAPPLATTDRLPPPALFECRTFDDAVYLGESANPPPRCAPLTTTGVGGTAAPAGAACEMVTDACQPVPAGALCDRWRQRLREMDSALTFGRLDDRETARVEIDRVRSIVTDSTCGL